jgi:sterol desaturase/sphingolipid hydroxylase (fatty acid hydroxylase superfamily)
MQAKVHHAVNESVAGVSPARLTAAPRANRLMSHLGYELLPPWLLRMPLLRRMNTANFHSLQHVSLKGNYGLMSRFWDRLLGTELSEYQAIFAARAAGLRSDT